MRSGHNRLLEKGFGISLHERQEGLVCEVILADLDVMPPDDCEVVMSNRSLQWRLGDPLRWRDRDILVTYYPLVAAASLREGGDSRSGDALKLGSGRISKAFPSEAML